MNIKEKLDEKSIKYLIVVALIAVLVIVGFYYYLSLTDIEKRVEPEKEGKKPLTEEETQKQLEELNELKKRTDPLTKEETEKQLEELQKLKQY